MERLNLDWRSVIRRHWEHAGIVQGSLACCQASVEQFTPPTVTDPSQISRLGRRSSPTTARPAEHRGASMRVGMGERVSDGARASWGDLSAIVGKFALSTGYPPAYPPWRRKVVDKGLFACEREGYTTRVGQSGAKWGERHVPG